MAPWTFGHSRKDITGAWAAHLSAYLCHPAGVCELVLVLAGG
jgi:hypothetical protein